MGDDDGGGVNPPPSAMTSVTRAERRSALSVADCRWARITRSSALSTLSWGMRPLRVALAREAKLAWAALMAVDCSASRPCAACSEVMASAASRTEVTTAWL